MSSYITFTKSAGGTVTIPIEGITLEHLINNDELGVSEVYLVKGPVNNMIWGVSEQEYIRIREEMDPSEAVCKWVRHLEYGFYMWHPDCCRGHSFDTNLYHPELYTHCCFCGKEIVVEIFGEDKK